jgi:hypothetical protein
LRGRVRQRDRGERRPERARNLDGPAKRAIDSVGQFVPVLLGQFNRAAWRGIGIGAAALDK